ncbi:ATP-binding protein [Streptomyces sp. NPDC057325]|uniref:ATP-binding protein n=1 Tax=unclassified Streptomyces TaxID=2593676 RepID=UPI00363E62AF
MNVVLQPVPSWGVWSVHRGVRGSRLALKRRPQVARLARRHATATLRGWGLPPERADDITLVVSELVANAEQHTEEGPWDLYLLMRGARVCVVVRDVCLLPPVQETESGPCADAERGRGLEIVRALAEAVRCHRFEAGKAMWAWMRIDPPGGVDPNRGGRLTEEAPPGLCSSVRMEPVPAVCPLDGQVRPDSVSRLTSIM